MYTKPAAPRSIGGVLDDAIKLYRDAFSTSWPLALIGQAVIAAPLLVIRLQLAAVPGVGANPMAAATNPAAAAAILSIYKSPAVLLSYLAVIILTFALYNALLAQIDGFATAKPRSLGESIAVGVRCWSRRHRGATTHCALGSRGRADERWCAAAAVRRGHGLPSRGCQRTGLLGRTQLPSHLRRRASAA